MIPRGEATAINIPIATRDLLREHAHARGVTLGSLAAEAISAYLGASTHVRPAPPRRRTTIRDDEPGLRGCPMAVTFPRTVLDRLHEVAADLDMTPPQLVRELITRWACRQRPAEVHP